MYERPRSLSTSYKHCFPDSLQLVCTVSPDEYAIFFGKAVSTSACPVDGRFFLLQKRKAIVHGVWDKSSYAKRIDVHPNAMVVDAGVNNVGRDIGVPPSQIYRAAERLKGHIRHTPVRTSRRVEEVLNNSQASTRFFFKCELFQRTGSFKFRGAFNAVSALRERCLEDGTSPPPVVTHSSGNHGQAVAKSAQMLGLTAHIVIPIGAPSVKMQAVVSYGACIARCRQTMHDRMRVADTVCERFQGSLVSPFDDPDVIAGQGTIALELLEQVPKLDAIIVPVGGGGMISGIAIAAKHINPTIRIFGAQPQNADDAARSLRSGVHQVDLHRMPVTIADGLKASLGASAWHVVSSLVEDIFTVTEMEIVAATKLIWSRMKLLIEPSAGVAVAVAGSASFRQLGCERVAVILCGGNIDLNKLPWYTCPKG